MLNMVGGIKKKGRAKRATCCEIDLTQHIFYFEIAYFLHRLQCMVVMYEQMNMPVYLTNPEQSTDAA